MYYVIIRGPLGCGKTTVAHSIAKNLNAEYIPIDRILDEHSLTRDHEEGFISQRSFIRANEIAARPAREFLKRGVPVIVDGNFYWKSQLEDLIARLQYPHYVFTLIAPLPLCIQRDAARSQPHGEDAAHVVYDKATEFIVGTAIDVDRPVEACVNEIISKIRCDEA